MKILIVIFGILLVLFIVVQLYAMSSQRNIETYPYKVLKQFPTFEIRAYQASLFTSVKLSPAEYREASGKGFRILAGYIFGGNERNEKIAMTSPVTMSLEDSMTMMFMVPKAYEKPALPQPNHSGIQFREEPEKWVAAIRFGGWANDEKIEMYKQKLISALDEAGISYTNRFYFFGYNPPYEVLNRRNEVIVELEPAAVKELG